LRVVISHISEEALLALLLKDFIESTFAGQCEVSLSVCSGESEADSQKLAHLPDAFAAATVLLLLCSHKATSEPWLHFELGCAWALKIPIVVVCHSGVHKRLLPPPLNGFDVYEAADEGFIEEFLRRLGALLGVNRLPHLSYEMMKAEIRATLASIAPVEYLRQTGKDTAEPELGESAAEKSAVAVDQSAPAKGSSKQERSGKAAAARAPLARKGGGDLSPQKEARQRDAAAQSREASGSGNGRRSQSGAAKDSRMRAPAQASSKAKDKADHKEKVAVSQGKTKKKVARKAAKKTAAAVLTKTRSVKSAVAPQRKKAAPPESTRRQPARRESIQTRVLKLLDATGETGFTLEDLADVLEIGSHKLEPYLDALKEQAYIQVSYPAGSPPEYTIGSKGQQYLTESSLHQA